MSLAFGSRFQFRMVGDPSPHEFDVPLQETSMFGAKGKTFLRGEQTTCPTTFEVMQDGFSTRAAAIAASQAVQNAKGYQDTLAITGETSVTAVLTKAREVRIRRGGGTTTGFHVRMTLEFEVIAS